MHRSLYTLYIGVLTHLQTAFHGQSDSMEGEKTQTGHTDLQQKSKLDAMDCIGNTWICEKEKMEREMKSLKAQLTEARIEDGLATKKEIDDLKSQFQDIIMTAPNFLDPQTTNIKNPRVTLQQTEKENKALKKEVENLKSHLSAANQTCAMVESHWMRVRLKVSEMEDALLKQKEEAEKTLAGCQASYQALLEEQKIAGIIPDRKVLTDLQDNVHLLQQEKAALQESNESFQAQLDEQRSENRKLVAALEETRASCLAQLDQQKVENGKLQTALVETEQEKASLLAQNRAFCVARLEEKKEEAGSYATALEKAERHLGGFREWQEEKSSLLQAAEELKQKLQEKEEESENKEALLQDERFTLRTQVDFLERKIAEKKKRKWYRRLRFTPHQEPEQVPDLLVFE